MTIYEFRKAFKDIATATKNDDSPRGVCTVVTDEVVPGDLVVIGGEFVEITAPTLEEINEQIKETSDELQKLNAERANALTAAGSSAPKSSITCGRGDTQ